MALVIYYTNDYAVDYAFVYATDYLISNTIGRDKPIYWFDDIFAQYRYRYIGIGKLDTGISLSESVSVIGY